MTDEDKPRGYSIEPRAAGADVFPFPRGVTPRSGLTVKMPAGAPGPRQPHPAEVHSLNDARSPVWYDVAVCHHWDGTIQTWIKGVDMENEENRPKVALALRQAADGVDVDPPFVDPSMT